MTFQAFFFFFAPADKTGTVLSFPLKQFVSSHVFVRVCANEGHFKKAGENPVKEATMHLSFFWIHILNLEDCWTNWSALKTRLGIKSLLLLMSPYQIENVS